MDAFVEDISTLMENAISPRPFVARGALATLFMLGSPEAIRAMQEAFSLLPDAAAASLALRFLEILAQGGSVEAVDALHLIAIENASLSALQFLNATQLSPSRSALRWALRIISEQLTSPAEVQNALEELTDAWRAASPTAQRRLLAIAARQPALANWAAILRSQEAPQPERVAALAAQFTGFTAAERALAVDTLVALSQAGHAQATQALGDIFFNAGDPRAAEALRALGVTDPDPSRQAMLLFLSGRWDEYSAFDLNHAGLVSGFSQATPALRRRILSHSRATGQIDWLRSANIALEQRSVSEMTDADWALAVDRLFASQAHAAIWTLAQNAPPLWSARMLARLAPTGWQPELGDQAVALSKLAVLAARAIDEPLSIRPVQSAQLGATLTALALHPTQPIAAAGSQGQDVFLWNIADPTVEPTRLISPAAVSRALLFSQDGQHLAIASGDHRLRVFRLADRQILKTLEGHKGLVRALMLTADGRTLVSAGFDGNVRLWRFPFGPQLESFQAAQSEIFSAHLLDEDQAILTASSDNEIRQWAVPGGRLLFDWPRLSAPVNHLALTPSHLGAFALRAGEIELWNTQTRRPLRAIHGNLGQTTALAFHPSELALFAGSASGQVSVIAPSTGEILFSSPPRNAPVIGIAFQMASNRLTSAWSDGRITAWDVDELLRTRLPVQHPIQNIVTPGTGAWPAFISELLRFKRQYDIELGESFSIAAGDFDIEID